MNNNSSSRRKSPRIDINAIIRCSKCISEGKVNVFNPAIEMKVLNISKDGLCICTSEVFTKDSLIEFELILEDVIYKSMFAKIIWDMDFENKKKYGVIIQNTTGMLSIHILKLEDWISESR